jgi:amino acid transporter
LDSQNTADSIHDQPVEMLESDPALDGHSDPPRTLTYFNCLALVIGLQIGSGIFSAPAVVSNHVSSPTIAILVWALAGVLVWTGAASFIELGTIVPANGGIQEYLRHCYGDVYGFLFAWMWIVVIKPCSMAMISLIFSEYLYKAIWPDAVISTWILKATSFLGVTSITALNYLGTRMGVGAANVFMTVKLLGLSSIAIFGFTFWAIGHRQSDVSDSPNHVGPVLNATQVIYSARQEAQSIWASSKDLVDALFAALFAYGGWESVNFSLTRS